MYLSINRIIIVGTGSKARLFKVVIIGEYGILNVIRDKMASEQLKKLLGGHPMFSLLL